MQEEEEEKGIPFTEIIGKTITDIYCLHSVEDGWLDTAECFIELDKTIYIDIPIGKPSRIWIKKLDPNAKTIFGDLSDIPTYHLNKDGLPIKEIIENNQKGKKNFFHRLRDTLFGQELIIKEFIPYKIEYTENKLKHILNRTISDYLWLNQGFDNGFFKLDNGYLISSQYMAPSGTGLAGLRYYENYESLVNWKGNKFSFLSGQTKE